MFEPCPKRGIRGAMDYEARNKLIIGAMFAGLVFNFAATAAAINDDRGPVKEKPIVRKPASKHKTKPIQKIKVVQPPKPATKTKAANKTISKPKALRRIAQAPANATRRVFSSRGSVRRVAPAAKPSTVSVAFSGKASWYSFRRNHGMYAAMRGYRGKRVRVTGPKGTIIVVINDYGPQKYTGKVIDLSAEAFKACIGPLSKGVGYVKLEILN